jgi:hypothetical protein
VASSDISDLLTPELIEKLQTDPDSVWRIVFARRQDTINTKLLALETALNLHARKRDDPRIVPWLQDLDSKISEIAILREELVKIQEALNLSALHSSEPQVIPWLQKHDRELAPVTLYVEKGKLSQRQVMWVIGGVILINVSLMLLKEGVKLLMGG